MTYHAVHLRLRRVRGPASEYDCICGKKAQSWSYDGTDLNEKVEFKDGRNMAYSEDLSRYQPLCRSCHVRRDRWAESPTHCKNGHEFTETNTYIRPDGFRTCRTCNRESQQRLRVRESENA